MPTCSNCGASVREGARFCTTCGTRLNDPVPPDATNVWATSATSDTGASASYSKPDSIWADAATDRGQQTPDGDRPGEVVAASAVETLASGDPDADATAQPSPATDGTFNWSWRSPSTADDAEAAPASAQVDEESGVVLEEDSSAAGPDSGELVDATEIDILEVDETGGEAIEAASPAPETSDALLVVEGDEGEDRQEESETLAAWAEQWETPDADDDAPANEPVGPPSADITTARNALAGAGGEEDEEDTVARAERLIGELRAIIPTLARPMAAAPEKGADAAAIAGELEEAARSGQFDDLRDVLLAARANPRDVDTMLSLSGRVDRLLELLDDRDNLASVSAGAATRLRPDAEAPAS